MTNLDSVLKSRDISLPIKVHISQGYGLPSAHIQLWEMDHKEGRAPKNWCLWTMVLEKTPESTLDNKRSNQSILRDITPEYLLEGLMLKLKLQYFGHMMWTANSLEKSLMLGKIDSRRRRQWQRMRWLDGITDAMDMNLWVNFRRWWGTEKPGVLQSMGLQRVRPDWATEQQQQVYV